MSSDKEKRIPEELKKFPLVDIEYELYYHGIKPMRVMDVSKIKLLSIVFVLLGLVVIYGLALHAPVMEATINDLYGNYLLNYATVVVKGNVTWIPTVSAQQGRYSVRFTVNDGTGELNIYIYDPLARQALASGKVPFLGDYVKAEVQIRVRETYTYGILQSLDTLKIERASAGEPMNVTYLTIDMNGKYVRVSGIITSRRDVTTGILLEVSTEGGAVTVLVPNLLRYLGGTIEGTMFKPNPRFDEIDRSLVIGAPVTISGIVYLYRGVSPEIVPGSLDDIIVETLVVNETVDLDMLKNHTGNVVRVNAVLGGMTYQNGYYWIDIYDYTGKAQAILPSQLTRELIDPFMNGTGSNYTIVGYACSDGTIAVITMTLNKPYPSPVLKVSQINESLKGYTVVVRGTVVLEQQQTTAPQQSYGCPLCDMYHGLTGRGASSHHRFKLVDDQGNSITVFMPSSAFGYLDPAMKQLVTTNGSKVTIAGYVDVYNDELEIVVYSASGVKPYDYQAPGEGKPIPTMPKPRPRTIKLTELSKYEGSYVGIKAVLGEVDRYVGGNYYVKVYGDGTSAIIVFPGDVFRRLNPFTAATGSEMLFIGKISGGTLNVEDFEVITGRPAPVLQVKDITSDIKGYIVAAKGTPQSVTKRQNSFVKFTLSDGTGSVTVFMPWSVYDGLPDDVKQAIDNGDTIIVAGYVDIYGGAVELVPFTPTGIALGSYQAPGEGLGIPTLPTGLLLAYMPGTWTSTSIPGL